MNTDPWIIVPPKDWAFPRWFVLLGAAVNVAVVVTFVTHGFAAGSTRSLIYAVIGGGSTLTWIALRQESREAARVADAMFLPAQLILLQLATPAFDWLGW